MANLSVATLQAIIHVVKNDADCKSHIKWAGGSYPWAGSNRNFTMQTQGRMDRFGRTGNILELIWGTVDISRWREQYVCVGIAEWTSIAINKAIRRGNNAALKTLDYAGPVSCGAFPHMGTGIRFKSGLSSVRQDKQYASKPLLQYVREDAPPSPATCDFVLDWWYRLDIASPWVFFSKEQFDSYKDGVDATNYVAYPLVKRAL